MLGRRTEQQRTALFVLDQLVLVAAFGAAWLLKRYVVRADVNLRFDAYAWLYIYSMPVVGLALSWSGLYRPSIEPRRPRFRRTREMLVGGFVAMSAVILVGFFIKPYALPDGALAFFVKPHLREGNTGITAVSYSRLVQYMFMVTGTLGLWASRALLELASRVRRTDEDARRDYSVLVFGMSRRVLSLVSAFERTSHLRVQVLGVAAKSPVPEDVGPRLSFTDATAQIEQGSVDHLIIAAESLERGELDRVMRLADREGISVHLTSSLFPSTRLTGTWDRVAGIPLIGFVSRELPLGARVIKRAFDVIVSGAGLLVLSPLLVVLAVLVKATSPGPVFYSQTRVGKHGRIFRMFKFRTMREDAEAETGPVWAAENDPRRTSIGAFLRRWNLDELPQLFNVLLGDMSLVGPRPERPELVGDFKRRIPRYAHKHWVKPGITGWAQVHGLRGNTSLEDRIDHDVYYIEHWSLMLDIRILVRTLWAGYANAA